MNDKILEAIAELDGVLAKADSMMDKIAMMVEEETDGALSVCSTNTFNRTVQLFHRSWKTDASDALEYIKSIADDGAVKVKWVDEIDKCYEFAVDRHPMCIILKKEDR